MTEKVKEPRASEGKYPGKASSMIGKIPFLRNVTSNSSQIEHMSTWPSGNDGMWFSDPTVFFSNPLGT